MATTQDWWSPTDASGPAADTGQRTQAPFPGRRAGHDADATPGGDGPGPLRRRVLVAVALVPWGLAGLLLAGPHSSGSEPSRHVAAAATSPALTPTDATAGNGPVADRAVLAAGDRGLVTAAARDLVAGSGGGATTRWAEHVVIEGAQRARPGVRLVAVTAITLEGRDGWTSVGAHAITVALLDGPAGTVALARWSSREPAAPTAASLEVQPEDDPDVRKAVEASLLGAGLAGADVVGLGSLPNLGLLVAEVIGPDPDFGDRPFHVLLDATDLHVLDDPWGDP